MAQKSNQELEQELAYYRDVVIPTMLVRENEMTRGWGNLWHKMKEENDSMRANSQKCQQLYSLLEDNTRLRCENTTHIQNHIDLSQYATSLEERCETLENIDAHRGKSVWNKAWYDNNMNRSH